MNLSSGLATTKPYPAWGLWIGLVMLGIAAGGCSLIRAPATRTSSLVQSVEDKVGFRHATNVLTALQNDVMRQADAYATTVAQASDDFGAKVGTPEARVAVLQWKLQQATAAYVNATGENPRLNAVDMVVLASLSCNVVSNYWVKQRFGDAALPWLEAHRKLERTAWAAVGAVLSPDQQKELGEFIRGWCAKNPDLRYVAAVRLRDFLGMLDREAKAPKPNSLLALFSIDPLAGLDPAVQAIEQTRYTAERMMYYVERAPLVLSWQAELLTFQLADQPAAKQLLSDAERVSRSAEAFARTAEQLPKLINDQREAAIAQALAGLGVERSNFVAALESQESKLATLLPEMRQTLATAGNMANSLDGAVKSLDAFVRYVSPPDTNPPVAITNKPFDVLEYGQAAAQIGAMARDLSLLVTSVNQTVPQIEALSQQAADKSQQVVHRAFWLGLVLIVVFLVGSVLAALTYRALANKMARAGNKSRNADQ